MNIEILNTEIVLENERVLLIPFENKRNQELEKVIFDDGIWKFMGMNMKSESDFKNYIANTLKDKKNGVCYPFLIIDKKSNKVVGSTRYGYLNKESEKCEIGTEQIFKELD